MVGRGEPYELMVASGLEGVVVDVAKDVVDAAEDVDAAADGDVNVTVAEAGTADDVDDAIDVD